MNELIRVDFPACFHVCFLSLSLSLSLFLFVRSSYKLLFRTFPFPPPFFAMISLTIRIRAGVCARRLWLILTRLGFTPIA